MIRQRKTLFGCKDSSEPTRRNQLTTPPQEHLYRLYFVYRGLHTLNILWEDNYTQTIQKAVDMIAVVSLRCMVGARLPRKTVHKQARWHCRVDAYLRTSPSPPDLGWPFKVLRPLKHIGVYGLRHSFQCSWFLGVIKFKLRIL